MLDQVPAIVTLTPAGVPPATEHHNGWNQYGQER